jgi:predicted membrane-bound spermidine synthase
VAVRLAALAPRDFMVRESAGPMARSTAFLLTFATGFSGLVYEVTWQRYLATLLGSHSEATAAVLGLFLGGLALGYAAFGRVARRLSAPDGNPGAHAHADSARRVLRAYGLIEAAIGAYAIVFPFLFSGVRAASAILPDVGDELGFGIDVVLAGILIGPPAVLMGATIPMLTQALPRGIEDATRVHAIVYALNTAGAFAGALAAAFVLVPALGLVGVLWAMAAVNGIAGALYFGLAGRVGTGSAPPMPASAPPVQGFALWAAAACSLGFAMMAIQTVLIRLGGLSFGATEYTFAIVVAVFVLCIALGSAAVSLLPRVTTRWVLADLWGLALVLGLLYGHLEKAPYWVHFLRTRFGAADSDFLPFQVAGIALVLLAIGPAVALSGAALPLVFHHLRREVGDLGTTAGRLYGWNTLGSLFGALIGGYALLFWLDLHHVYRAAVGAVLVAAALVTARVSQRSVWGVAFATLGVLGLAALPAWRGEWLSLGAFRLRTPTEATEEGPAALVREQWEHRRIIHYDDDPTLTAMVTETRDLPERSVSIVTNGKSDGNTIGDFRTMSLIALVPALLADRVDRGFVIGFGTGITAGELASLPGVREVEVAEISKGVLDAAPFFDFANGGASQHPKIHNRRSDAYRALLRSDGSFDVILSEPSNPWTAGVEMLFSVEYLEAARARLAPGGIYAQWMHQYETSPETLALVLRTFAEVFPAVSIWYTNTYDLMILGFEDADANSKRQLDRVIDRFQRPAFQRILRRAKIPNLYVLLSHELVPSGVVHALDLRGPLHTLLRPRLGHVAGRAFFRGRAAILPFSGGGEAARIGAQNSLLGRYRAQQGDRARLPSLAVDACTNRTPLCATLLASWRVRFGASPAWKRAVDGALQPRWIFGPPLERERLTELRALFSESGPIGAVPFERAARASELYRRYYQHAYPFDPERLLGMWARCQPAASAPGGCRRGLESARAMLAGTRDAKGEMP